MKDLLASIRRALVPVVALVVLLLSWMLVRPVGGFPDDSFHFANIWCDEGISGYRCFDEPGTALRRVPNAFTDGSPWWGTSGYGTNLTQTGSVYPELFYTAMRPFAGESVVASVLAMRLFNVLTAVVMLCSAYVVTPTRRRPSALAVWLVMAPGLGLFYLASSHPFAWLYLGTATGWVFAASIFDGRSSRIRAASMVGLLVSLLLVIGSRPEGLLVAPLVVLVGSSISAESRLRGVLARVSQTNRSRLIGVAAAGGLVGIVIAWRLLDSRVARTFVSEIGRSISGGRAPQLVDMPHLYLYVVGANTTPTEFGVFGAQSAFLVFAAAGLVVLGAGIRGWSRWTVTVVVSAIAVTAPLVWTDRNELIVRTPPRYLVGIGVLLIASLVVTSDSAMLRAGRYAFVVVAVTVGHAFSLHGALQGYRVGEPPEWQFGLNGGLKWWWQFGVSPQSTWLLGSLSFACLSTWGLLQLRSQAETSSS